MVWVDPNVPAPDLNSRTRENMRRLNAYIQHSATVTEVDAAGNVTEVCGKWGCLPTYCHAPEDSIYTGERIILCGGCPLDIKHGS